MSRRSLLSELLKLHDSNDAVKRGIEVYSRALDTPEHKVFRDMLLTIKGSMLNDMLSNDFTELEQSEKDVMQRAYYHINQFIDFLVGPTRYIQKRRSKLTPNHVERALNAQRGKERANEERKAV